ncbi:hypothetical protein B0H16DRAFT_1666429 [Mycena metata]|uniref:Integrase core domain-containing protein n=1 Tax=Mycena metata TaxID=1033252 RepID=A0AAD7HH78_9AGAR|nr:hypothetical protein B0H16DRAFT_1666429 [Mycena metata]
MLTRELGRASFIWGSSTHNTRIERLWVEVGSQFARRWRAFFYRLEALHGLDRSNPHHLWLLHLLFLDMINNDCDDFRAEWNCHPISGEGHSQSPNDMAFIGQVQHGVYADDYEDVHPTILERYYGVHGRTASRASGQTGAGQLDDEDVPLPPPAHGDDDDSEDSQIENNGHLAQQIEDAHANNFHHDPVPVPKHANPFPDDTTMQIFHEALSAANDVDLVPEGYGLLPDEWVDGVYPTFEILKSGRRGTKQLRVALPDSIWRPRAEMWGRGLAILDHLGYMNEQ